MNPVVIGKCECGGDIVQYDDQITIYVTIPKIVCKECKQEYVV